MSSNKMKNYNSENSYSLALNKQVLINSWDQRNVFEFQGNMNKKKTTEDHVLLYCYNEAELRDECST